MLHLVYVMRPTIKARADLPAFWKWVREREAWFYDRIEEARDPRWLVRTVGSDVHALEHSISFSDEAAWGAYRKEVHRRAQDPEWERRRVEQNQWWEILEARLLNDAPLPPASS